MQTVTWSCVSRSVCPVPGSRGPGSRWPGTAVVAAVSSVTSLLRAGIRSPPTASNLPPAAHDEKRAAPPRSLAPVTAGRQGRETRVPRRRSRLEPGFHRVGQGGTGSALLGLPEDLVDLLDLGQQFVRL